MGQSRNTPVFLASNCPITVYLFRSLSVEKRVIFTITESQKESLHDHCPVKRHTSRFQGVVPEMDKGTTHPRNIATWGFLCGQNQPAVLEKKT